MGVVPVGPRLSERILHEDRLTGRKRILRDLGNAIHVVGNDHSMPMDRAGILHRVVQKNLEHVTFGVANLGSGVGSIDQDGFRRRPQRCDRLAFYVEHVIRLRRRGHHAGDGRHRVCLRCFRTSLRGSEKREWCHGTGSTRDDGVSARGSSCGIFGVRHAGLVSLHESS